MNDNDIKVGDVCTIHSVLPGQIGYELNGTECLVIEYVQGFKPDAVQIAEYRIQTARSFYPGNRIWIDRGHLWKKRPPQPQREDLTVTQWSECVWRPTAVSA